MLDPEGDLVDPPGGADIESIGAIFTDTALAFEITFFTDVTQIDRVTPTAFIAIDIDTDQDPTTGTPSLANFFELQDPGVLGSEFDITFPQTSLSEATVRNTSSQATLLVPVMLSVNSLSLSVPLDFLGSDDRLVNYSVIAGPVGAGFSFQGFSDIAPNEGFSTSAAEPGTIGLFSLGLIFLMFNSAGRNENKT